MALRCAATRYASLLFSKTVHAAPRSGGSRYLLPERQMSRLASPTYLSACATLPQQAFDYFLLLDFEATCSAEKGVPTPQEIIEFPVLKVNGRTFETEATFHTYVQPQAHPQLTAFCIEASLAVCLPGHTSATIHDSVDQLKEGVLRLHGSLAQDPAGCTALLWAASFGTPPQRHRLLPFQIQQDMYISVLQEHIQPLALLCPYHCLSTIPENVNLGTSCCHSTIGSAIHT
ncbi:snipper isoform X7 [Dermacentor variabilis]|uniref:snipper isoform X7 n=1 Tax=Dermacentor variabilis TaxID=34621 RepID=UPI003F5B18E8